MSDKGGAIYAWFGSNEGEGWDGYATACEASLLFKCKHLQRGLVISSKFQLYKKRS